MIINKQLHLNKIKMIRHHPFTQEERTLMLNCEGCAMRSDEADVRMHLIMCVPAANADEIQSINLVSFSVLATQETSENQHQSPLNRPLSLWKQTTIRHR